MSGLFAERFVQPNSNVYDLGCSLGTTTLALRSRITAPGVKIIAVRQFRRHAGTLPENY